MHVILVRDNDEEEVIAEDYDEHGTTDLQQNYAHNKQGGKLVTEDTKAVSYVHQSFSTRSCHLHLNKMALLKYEGL